MQRLILAHPETIFILDSRDMSHRYAGTMRKINAYEAAILMALPVEPRDVISLVPGLHIVEKIDPVGAGDTMTAGKSRCKCRDWSNWWPSSSSSPPKSGSDEDDVIAEAQALGYADLFHGRIYGAVGDVTKEAKKIVMDRILTAIGADQVNTPPPDSSRGRLDHCRFLADGAFVATTWGSVKGETDALPET